MRQVHFASTLLVLAAALSPAAGLAQQALPRPGQGGLPPAPTAPAQRPAQPAPPPAAQPGPQAQGQPAPPKPYKPVAVTAPKPTTDAGLAALRKQIATIAEKKDRAGLAQLVVAQGFFWMKESGDGANKAKSGIDNLAAAVGLDDKDGGGWDALADFASDESAVPFPDRKGVMCGPAGPQFNEQELDKVAQATGTDIGEWGYPVEAAVEVRGAAQATAPVIEKLGMHFVRVMPEAAGGSEEFMRIVTPSGKVGFVAGGAVAPLGSDQLCYGKDARGAWKIVGFLGGAEQ